MNIEQKNALFVVSLVMAVLVALAGVMFLLVREHVETSINTDLERARNAFGQLRVNSFESLLTGRKFNRQDVAEVKQRVYADVVVFSGSRLLASTIDNIQPELNRLKAAADDHGWLLFELAGERYSGTVLRLRYPSDSDGGAVDLLLAVRHSVYWAPYRVLGENALYFSLLILLTAVLLGISISRRTLTRPIQLLAHATRAISNGDLNINVPGKRGDELGQLTRSFNRMLETLQSSREDLENSRQRFLDFAASSSDWLWETDGSGRFSYVSETVSNTIDMPVESWLGKTPAELPGSVPGELMDLLQPHDSEPASFKDVEIWLRNLQGDQHCLRLNAVPVYTDRQFTGFRGTVRDITKLKQDERRMVVLANQDHLTGLYNRRRFLQDLQHEILRAQRSGQAGVLLLIDLDHLKLVNDTAGHAIGDRIIVQVAGYLKDASCEQDLLARISGDEFAVACVAMTEQQGIERAHRILERITTLKPVYAGRTLNVTASIGMVTFPQQGEVPVELLAKADAAMSSAKEAGRNRVYRYDENAMMRERMDDSLVWKDRLLEALENNALRLVFQPIVALFSSPVHHYEVLVRMQDDDGSLIEPGKFIPVAERFGFIQKLDRWVLSRAIHHLAELPPELDSIGFSINLSGMSVGDHGMYELIEREVREAGVDPHRITFEITETAACEQLNTAIEFIRKVRCLGCQVSLDDFGAGFSSFSYLKHLHADVLKIDGSFIRDIHNSKSDQMFVKALVDVARGMGMRTVAEFVENEQVFQRVLGLGVDYVQGYYLGKPGTDLIIESANKVVERALPPRFRSVG